MLACTNLQVYDKLVSQYKDFVSDFEKKHPGCSYPAVPSWEDVQADQRYYKIHPEEHPHTELSLYGQALPTCNVHQEIIYIETHTETEILTHVHEVVNYWIDQINECKSHSEYIYMTGQLENLVLSYHHHGVHIGLPHFPQWIQVEYEHHHVEEVEETHEHYEHQHYEQGHHVQVY